MPNCDELGAITVSLCFFFLNIALTSYPVPVPESNPPPPVVKLQAVWNLESHNQPIHGIQHVWAVAADFARRKTCSDGCSQRLCVWPAGSLAATPLPCRLA